ncbi:hypothetical protein SAMN04487764_1987 [Gillisia sp. Hel1_33_143]|uniref:hypothetical protein n=1 Tax=Gillisia sp. Hel1_33_143 TaxID=1336796 RepID=UPI00087BBE30|nr:hypothetical protein [Gillisia sp. Hel1_33_143]SDS33627.1 hypothetical protein SAMN04487764_1987 [Gillisia sp. Hel1_33_143]
MAKIIEICGVPGVGKSTIFSELEKIEKIHGHWRTSSNLKPLGDKSRSEFLGSICSDILKGKKPRNKRTKMLESNLDYIKRIYRTLKLGRKFVDTYVLKEAGLRFIQEYPEYIDACWQNIYYKQSKSANGLDLRFEKAEFIYLILKKIQVLMELKSNRIMLIDEGLINLIDRALYESSIEISEESEIKKRVDTMPWPSAIVYVQTDLDEIANRILGRKDIRDMHRNLDRNELMMFTDNAMKRIEIAIEHLKSYGVPVLDLDSSHSVQSNTQQIIDFATLLGKNELEVVNKEILAI